MTQSGKKGMMYNTYIAIVSLVMLSIMSHALRNGQALPHREAGVGVVVVWRR